MNAMRSYSFAMTALLVSVSAAAAQLPPPTVVPPVPNLNPSSSLVLPPLHQAPVSPASLAEGVTKEICHRCVHIRRLAACSAGTRAILQYAAFSTTARAFLITCRRSDRI